MTGKIEQFWRAATADDVEKLARTGELSKARFRDSDTGEWFVSSLCGWTTGKFGWYSANVQFWQQCQVYDPPQWYVNKPDPGLGYRLLEKLPDEPLEVGDEFFKAGWIPSCLEIGDPQTPGLWYRRKSEQLLSGHRWLTNGERLESKDLYYEKGSLLEVGHEHWGNKVMLREVFMRKIEQPKPKFAIGQRVKVVGPKQRMPTHWDPEMERHIGLVYTAVSAQDYLKHPSGTTYFYSVGGIHDWAFREDYLEPAVEPKHYVLIVGDTISTPSGRQAIVTEHGIEIS
jgi:hypothetical protein